MATEGLTDVIARQTWLDAPGKALQDAAKKFYDSTGQVGLKLMNFLHGTWLGHPLHPTLTDVPVGAWTAALLIDTIDVASSSRKGLETAADAAIALGVVGAAGAAAAGLTDWHRLRGERTRRLGTMHLLFNTSALVLHGASLALRGSGQRGAGRAASLLGYAAMGAGAFLGGHLAYSEQVGPDHNARLEPPEDWVRLLPEAQLPVGELRRAEANGVPVLLYRHGNEIHAMVETCGHMGGPLSEGHVEDGTVACPWHGSRYALDSGAVREGPSTYAQPVFEVRVRDGQIEVRAG